MRSLTISISDDLARLVDSKVAAGEYATESDMVQDGLMALLGRDGELDRRMSDEVAVIYDRMVADPSRGIPIDDVLARIGKRASTDI